MEEIAKIKKDLKDTLFLGLSATLSEYVVPSLVADFHKEFPSATVKIFTGNSHDVEDGLLSGVLNVGIIEREPANKFVSIPWLEDEIIFFTYPGNSLAEEEEDNVRTAQHTDRGKQQQDDNEHSEKRLRSFLYIEGSDSQRN